MLQNQDEEVRLTLHAGDAIPVCMCVYMCVYMGVRELSVLEMTWDFVGGLWQGCLCRA